jgi:rubrerythrin
MKTAVNPPCARAYAETVHALNHLEIIGKTKSSLENLKTAVSGETFEFDEMYPKYIETAKQEGKKRQNGVLMSLTKWKRFMQNCFLKQLKLSKATKRSQTQIIMFVKFVEIPLKGQLLKDVPFVERRRKNSN